MRTAEIQRDTNETKIRLSLNVDGEGKRQISTGIGFFDHMLDLFARHGLFDISLEAKGDLHVDAHHTMEDVGIALGEAFTAAVGDKAGICRYSTQFVPMDEALVFVSADFSGRAYLKYDVVCPDTTVGTIPVQLFEEFFRAFAVNAKITLHIVTLYGDNTHHMIEAVFKAAGRALRFALEKDARSNRYPVHQGSAVMIAIADYGMGNLRSVQKAFEYLGFEAAVTDDRRVIRDASHVVLPGVGAFADAVAHLNRSGLGDAVAAGARSGKPFLGICLGMQLMFERSFENGEYEGFGLVPGEVVPFRVDGLKVPHMGWNDLVVRDNPMIDGAPFVYFVHSYHATGVPEKYVIAEADYGYRFTAAVQKDNMFGLQFHPEKSGDAGLAMLKKFGEMS